MMDETKYKKLLEKLDSCLQISHPYPCPTDHKSVGLLLPDTDISAVPKDQLSLVHTMLHMFASNKNGRGLTPKTIERLHKEVVGRMPKHKKYDGLDK